MFTDVAACVSHEAVHINAVAVDIVEEDLVSVAIGPVITEVDHCSAVSVTTAGIRGVVLDARFVAPPSVIADIAGVVQVISDGFDVVENVAVEVFAGLALVVSALDDVIEVRDDASGDEGLAMIIEVHTPGV